MSEASRGVSGAREVQVGLSTASVWPLGAVTAFEIAAELGYDGVEVMVWADPVSQDVAALRRVSERTGVPVLAVHSPSLLITQRVWSPDPAIRLRRSVSAAMELGADTVVVHPPFRWQRRYGDVFAHLVAELEEQSSVAVAVENMFTAPVSGRANRMSVFRPSIDPTDVGYRNYTLDLSHSAAAGTDALALADRMGKGLRHVHLGDGSGSARDEHLVPGRGVAPCAELLDRFADGGFDGQIVLEVNTRRAGSRTRRIHDLAEALLFTRLHLGQPA